jgi:glutathione S-transferase
MLTLVIGDKNLSSWSLRPWMLLKHLRLPFEEVRLPLDTPRFRAEIGRYSPNGRVPVLLDGATRVWDSLAICEYVNELTNGAAWPTDRAARAEARSICAEMHSGFQALRSTWTLRAAAQGLHVPLPPEAAADAARIDALWSEYRSRYAAQGEWLFGRYSIADAMYAPVALRFKTYGAKLLPTSNAYLRHALADEYLQQWVREAALEIAAEGRPDEHT